MINNSNSNLIFNHLEKNYIYYFILFDFNSYLVRRKKINFAPFFKKIDQFAIENAVQFSVESFFFCNVNLIIYYSYHPFEQQPSVLNYLMLIQNIAPSGRYVQSFLSTLKLDAQLILQSTLPRVLIKNNNNIVSEDVKFTTARPVEWFYKEAVFEPYKPDISEKIQVLDSSAVFLPEHGDMLDIFEDDWFVDFSDWFEDTIDCVNDNNLFVIMSLWLDLLDLNTHKFSQSSLINVDDLQWWYEFISDPYLQKMQKLIFFSKLEFMDENLELIKDDIILN